MNNSNNIDMSKALQMLSKMDKKDLEAGIAKANELLKTKSKEEIINELTNKKTR